jgi:hypothetical protein
LGRLSRGIHRKTLAQACAEAVSHVQGRRSGNPHNLKAVVIRSACASEGGIFAELHEHVTDHDVFVEWEDCPHGLALHRVSPLLLDI